MKEYRKGQSRKGSVERRELEFAVIMDQLTRRREAFQARLASHLDSNGECLCYRGTLDHKGYARINFKYQGSHVSIHAHRVFLILKILRPIPLEFEAGHEDHCAHRTCVRHVQLEHYKSNAATYDKRVAA